MRSIFFTSCLIFLGVSIYGQSWTSSTQISGTDDLNVIKSINDINDNTIILGQFLGEIDLGAGNNLVSYGSRDYFLLKFDSNGALDWGTNIGGPNMDYVLGGVGTNQNGDIYVAGAFMNKAFFTPSDSIEGISQDIFLAKYTTDGNLDWYKNAGTGGKFQRPSTLSINESGNILLSGFFKDSIKFDETTTLYSENAAPDYFYSEFDSDGNLTWSKQVKASNTTLSGRVFDIATNSSYYTMTGVYSDTVTIDDVTLVSDTLYDVHVIRTNLAGDLGWVRSIGGMGDVYSYNITSDDNENIYVAGYYNSPSLIIDSTETEQVTIDGNAGSYDFFVVKYDTEGTFQWVRTNGGVSIDKLFDIEYFDEEVTVCGYFTDSIKWGGRILEAEGDDPGDKDMFTGSLDLDGNYRDANRFGGRNNSHEESYSIAITADKKYNVIRSNSDLLHLGDDTYFSVTGKYYLVFGVVGCLPISVDNAIASDVTTCFGDSTGTIQISASGGFGSPWEYSIDNGSTYQKDLTLFSNLPAGSYPVVVVDSEGCSQEGPTVDVGQPDPLVVEVLQSGEEGEAYIIVTAASGGTSPYSFTLLPNNINQQQGTFRVDTAGMYEIILEDRNGCGPDSTGPIILGAISSETLMSLKVYPNPSSDLVNVEMQLDAAEVNLEVVSLTGQIVMRKQAFTSGGEVRETLDVSNLARGMYMLRVNGETLRSAIVVQ